MGVRPIEWLAPVFGVEPCLGEAPEHSGASQRWDSVGVDQAGWFLRNSRDATGHHKFLWHRGGTIYIKTKNAFTNFFVKA